MQFPNTKYIVAQYIVVCQVFFLKFFKYFFNFYDYLMVGKLLEKLKFLITFSYTIY